MKMQLSQILVQFYVIDLSETYNFCNLCAVMMIVR